MWKAQIAALSRRFRIVTFDPRGNGRTDRPDHVEAYGTEQEVEDAVAVLDVAGVERAVVAGLCSGAGYGVALAPTKPERVAGLVTIAPNLPLAPAHPHRVRYGLRRAPPDRRGLGPLQPPLLAARLAGVRGVLPRRADV